LEPNKATAKEIVVRAYADAECASSGGLYQIRRPLQNASPGRLPYLSSQHVTAEEAWYFAATRVLTEDTARIDAGDNKEAVLRAFPNAYCAPVRCGYFQIQRPRTLADKRSVLKYMPLSGRFSSEDFAWQDAAQGLFGSAPRTNLDASRFKNTDANSATPTFRGACAGEQNSGSRF
jgi:hypothetical protein